MEQKKKFYQKVWFMWVTLIVFVFAPVGIFLMWKYHRFNVIGRIVLSVIFGFIFLFVITPSSSDKTQNTGHTSQVEQEKNNNDTQTKSEVKTENNAENDAQQNESEEKVSDENTEQSGESEKVEEEKKPTIDFSNVLVSNQMGMLTVYGEAKNNDSKEHSFTLKVTFYDDARKIVGTASGAMNNLNGGDMKIFSAIGTDDLSNATAYKVQVDTMIASQENSPTIIEFSEPLIKSVSSMTTIDVEAKNLDNKTHSFTGVVGFYDENEKLIGVASGALNGIEAGTTKTFSAMANGDYSKATSYKIQVDTLVE